MHIVYAKLGQADAGDNEAKLIKKLAPEWVRTSATAGLRRLPCHKLEPDAPCSMCMTQGSAPGGYFLM